MINIEKSKLPDGLNGVASINEITVQRPLRWLFCAARGKHRSDSDQGSACIFIFLSLISGFQEQIL